VIDDEERKLGREQRQKPLRGVHVSGETEVHEVIKQVRQLFLQVHRTTSQSPSASSMKEINDVKYKKPLLAFQPLQTVLSCSVVGNCLKV